jgi:hypothetical protein
MSKRVFAAGAPAFLCALPCAAQDDAEGAKDHPVLSRMPGYYIDDYDANDFGSVQGHTDNVRIAAQNLKLSQDRAAAVKGCLAQTFGVAAERMTASGFGDTRPVADNGTDQGRAQNRRVELVKP